MSDEDFLKLAVEAGKKSKSDFKFGAVMVKDGRVIAADCNHVAERSDPSAHAEVSTIVEACKTEGNHNLKGCTLYASHEPCIMCFACAAWAAVERVVYSYPASEINDDMYEFKGVSLKDMASKLIRPMKLEQVRIME